MSRSTLTGIVVLVLAGGGAAAVSSPSGAASNAPSGSTLTHQQCEALADFEETTIARTSITTARAVDPTASTPEHCAIRGTVENKAGGLATFQVSLPLQNYDGRFKFMGSGGAAGSISAPNPAWLSAGNAVATSNLVNHSGGGLDFGWARNNREAEIDFGYRATHEATVIAKHLIAAAYGAPPKWSYFDGGSTGGRQGLVEAQRYPHDYDGIVNRMPAVDETSLGTLHLLWSALSNLDGDGNPILSNDDAELLHRAALDRCDGADGLTDGLITDPRYCDFTASMSDLSPRKARAAQRIYDGARNSSGTQLTPGAEVGSELNWRNNYLAAPGAEHSVYYLFGGSFTRDAAYEVDLPESWKPEDFNWDTDPAGLEFMEQFYTASNSDLSAFKKSGGKILQLQGWADQSVVPGYTVDYYEKTVQHMGGRSVMDDFYRLFMVPGMGHTAVPVDTSPVIEDWVERGVAPDSVLATNMAGATKAATRPLFPYPLVSRWSGRGDVDDPTTWVSADPGTSPSAVTVPGKVRRLRVKRGDGQLDRVVTWREPARTGGAAVLHYLVAITQHGKLRMVRRLPASQVRIDINTRALGLLPGQAQVGVSAVNVKGEGPTATAQLRISTQR